MTFSKQAKWASAVIVALLVYFCIDVPTDLADPKTPLFLAITVGTVIVWAQDSLLAKRIRSSYCRHREDAMKELFYLSHEQIARIKRYFPRSHGIPRVDDRRVISGIIYVIKHGLQWKDAPREYGPYKTLYNRFIRWSRLGVFNRIFAELVEQNGSTTRLMIDATHLKAHRTAASLLKKGAFPDVSDAQKAA